MMGKQSRRKNRNKPKQSNRKGDDSPRNPSSAVHQLRHPDPKTRHRALIAMQATFLHNVNKRVSLPVLQAVREQVMDKDMDCASTAAECLAMYISYAEKGDNKEHQDVMASWTLILVSRLDQCHQAIQAGQKNSKQWYALASPSLRALCKLIEMNEMALEQMDLQKQTFLSAMFGLLHDASTQEATLDPKFTDWVYETAVYAARCVHSSIDDNFEMVDIINGNNNIIDLWPKLMTSLPELAQLHIAGCIISLYQVAPSSWQSSCIFNQVLPCLSRSLVVDDSNLQTLEENYRQAKLLWLRQKEDDQLEKEVLQSIATKREPARMIAKRLKQQPRGEKAMMENQEDGRQAMDDSLTAWNNSIMSLQLGLEVTANLLSCLIQDEDEMALERDENSDRILHQSLVTTKIGECIVRMLQNMCTYNKNLPTDSDKLLRSDIQETISKISACLANCVLSNVLVNSDFAATWQILRQHPNDSGVCSVMAALVQNSKSLRDLAVHDLEIIQGMLHTTGDEGIQRDAVYLLSAALGGHPPVEVVTKLTSDMIRLMNEAATTVKCEVLRTIMNLYGEDDFYPQVFMSLDTLNYFKQCIIKIPQKELGPEEEDILFNANRFVEYKLGR